MYLSIITKGFGPYPSMSVWFIGWGVSVLSIRYLGGFNMEACVFMCMCGDSTWGPFG